MLWCEKYKPKSLSEVVGHGPLIDLLRRWASAWERGDGQKPLLLDGPPGIGKTAVATALVREAGWEMLEMNASDLRSRDKIDHIAGAASSALTFSGKKRLILFDEIDGMFTSDRGGTTAVRQILKNNPCPIILTANDSFDPKLRDIRAACQLVKIKKVHYAMIAKVLEKIAIAENKKIPKDAILRIAKNSHGDVRSAINDLQVIAEGEPASPDVIGERDREENIFNAMRTIFKSTDFNHSRNALKNLSEDPEFILKWIEENIPKEYLRKEDLYIAFDTLSRADVFLGRVNRRQYYGFWRYASDLMSSGIALSKREKYNHFASYSFPTVVRYLSASKSKRELCKQIALKIAKQCHVSSKTAMFDYIPLFQMLVKKEPALLAAQFVFDEDELDFFGVEDPNAVLLEAEKIRSVARSAAALDKNQLALSTF